MKLIESIELHETLNDKLFDLAKKTLKPEVKEKLNNIANEFLTNIDIPLNVVDIELVGSNAAFNYTDTSDIDLHIIVNTELTYVKDDILQQLYNLKKNSFNKNYDLSINGLPVEVYIEDVNASNATNGRYSIIADKWVKEPVYEKHEIPDISQQFNDCMTRFNEVVTSDDTQAIQDYINEIYMMRKLGLEAEGEYSVGNLVFKELRNNEVLDKLKDRYYELMSNRLSLNESKLTESENIRTFTEHSDEYQRLVDFANELNDYCINNDINIWFDVDDVYFDYGQDWKWTNILGHSPKAEKNYFNTVWQVLTPKQHELVIQGRSGNTLNEIVSQIEKEFLVKEKPIEESFDRLNVTDNNVYVAKNPYGYTKLGLIIDDTNKQYQLVNGQTLPLGKFKKTSGKDIDRKIDTLKQKGYTEFKGYGSLDR